MCPEHEGTSLRTLLCMMWFDSDSILFSIPFSMPYCHTCRLQLIRYLLRR
jgi:hypothetical protein